MSIAEDAGMEADTAGVETKLAESGSAGVEVQAIR